MLLEGGIDGWLIHDFRGSNPFGQRILGLSDGIFTRRWYLWIPARGPLQLLIHDIEQHSFAGVDIERRRYNSRTSLEAALKSLLAGATRVAMEFSPHDNIPYLGVVPAGVVDQVRSYGVEVVSSADLLQLFMVWTPEQQANHRRAARVLAEVKDAAFNLLRQRVAAGQAISEFELQTQMLYWMHQQGMETDHAPTVAFGDHVGVGHYAPAPQGSAVLQPGPVVLDLWCKVPGPNPYADIAWMAHWGTPSSQLQQAFEAALSARDLGIEFLQQAFAAGRPVRGCEVDQVVRQHLEQAGFAGRMRRRTGHSLGIAAVHGEVAHFDDFETLDERRVLPGLGFTIEPGFPLERYGVHTEINLITHADSIEVTTPVQHDWVRLD